MSVTSSPITVDDRDELNTRERIWTTDDLDRAYQVGLFDPNERYELLEGHLYRKMSQNNPHYMTVAFVREALRAAFGSGYCVLDHSPLKASPTNQPEPDVMVLPGDLRDWDGRDPRPEEVVLVVEVSDTTLTTDRGYKAGLYARMGVGTLWIVDLNARRAEIRRKPFDAGLWGEILIFDESQAVPLPDRDTTLAVAALPPQASQPRLSESATIQPEIVPR